jgi:hypothetical protein
MALEGLYRLFWTCSFLVPLPGELLYRAGAHRPVSFTCGGHWLHGRYCSTFRKMFVPGMLPKRSSRVRTCYVVKNLDEGDADCDEATRQP